MKNAKDMFESNAAKHEITKHCIVYLENKNTTYGTPHLHGNTFDKISVFFSCGLLSSWSGYILVHFNLNPRTDCNSDYILLYKISWI